MAIGIKTITAPTVEPVTLEQAKEHIGIPLDDTGNDQIIRQVLYAARQYAEEITGRSFINTVWEEAFDRFPVGAAFSPIKSPLVSVASITYVDTAGASQTVTAGDYVVDVYRQPGRVALAYGESWPTARYQPNAVLLRYTAGYGTAATDVPQRAKQAVLLLAAHWFDNPEPVLKTGAQALQIPLTISDLLMALSDGALV